MALATTDALAAKRTGQGRTIYGGHFIHQAVAPFEGGVYVPAAVRKEVLRKAGLEE
jgi:hypothetical protein